MLGVVSGRWRKIVRRRAAAGSFYDPPGKAPVTCLAPQYLAEELLHAEGFTDVRYIASDNVSRPRR